MATNKHPKKKLARRMMGAKAGTGKVFFSKAWMLKKDGIQDRVERQAGMAHKRAIVRRKDYKPIISRAK